MDGMQNGNGCFIKDYELRSLDTDCGFMLRPNIIQEILQDAAGRHAELLGLGIEALQAENLTWVLMSSETEIFDKVDHRERLTVKTWPIKSNGVRFQREYIIYGGDNREIAKSTSIWVLIEMDSRKVAVKKDAYQKITEFLTEKAFSERYTKVPILDDDCQHTDIQVKMSDIDINRHVNNTKYLSYVVDNVGIEENMRIMGYKIDYLREVKLHEVISLYFKRVENSFIAKGVVDGETVFCAEITVSKDKRT